MSKYALPGLYVACAFAAAVHSGLVGMATELSLQKDATQQGWRITGPSGTRALHYTRADGQECARAGIIDSCAISNALGLK